HRCDADISPATAALRPQQLSAPASSPKTRITQHRITVPVAPTVLKTALAALALPSFPIESQKSDQTPAPNPHSLTPAPVRTPPRFELPRGFLPRGFSDACLRASPRARAWQASENP